MAAAISAVLIGAPPPASLTGEAKQRRAAGWGGGGWMPVECSSRPTKKGTAHHMKTRPKKTQPWDVKRKGPTLYPSLPPLPPDWTFADNDGAAAAQQSEAAASDASLAAPATAVAP